MRKLTCYAWGKPGDWEALCVDLDIPAVGDSFEEVRDELTAAVADFLDYVAELPGIERDTILRVRAPWRVRTKLAVQLNWFSVRSTFRSFALGGRKPNRAQLNRAGFVVSHAP